MVAQNIQGGSYNFLRLTYIFSVMQLNLRF